VKDLFPKLKERGMDTVAVTDHGNMFGAIDLYTEAKNHDVKVIFGCETYVASADLTDRTNRRNYHLVLLAENEVGYKNLSYLNSMGYLKGFYYNPRVDKNLLRERAQGLIATSACLGGEIAQTLTKNGVAAAESVAREYQDIFGQGNFFLELMPTKTPEQQELNEALVKMATRLDMPLVATNDCHYINQQDAAAHEVLLAIQTGKSLTDDRRL
jgi:DNA polymerase-3 subunit alpha